MSVKHSRMSTQDAHDQSELLGAVERSERHVSIDTICTDSERIER